VWGRVPELPPEQANEEALPVRHRGALKDAIEAVLAEPSYGERARALATELRAEPPVDATVPLCERLATL
jgi:UDP:flavonoid glycosyltransferase YjiC (YdhE family)